MRLICPYCRKEVHFIDMVLTKDMEYVFNVITRHELGKRYGTPALAYVSLFAVTPFHLKSSKFRRILEEIVKLYDAQAFSYQKKLYPISHAGIIEAIDICIKKNFTDVLENHNYLKKIMIGISEREGKSESRAAEKDLRAREDRSVAGGGHRESSPSLNPSPQGREEKKGSSPLRGEDEGGGEGSRITPEQAKANIQRVGEILKTIGG